MEVATMAMLEAPEGTGSVLDGDIGICDARYSIRVYQTEETTRTSRPQTALGQLQVTGEIRPITVPGQQMRLDPMEYVGKVLILVMDDDRRVSFYWNNGWRFTLAGKWPAEGRIG